MKTTIMVTALSVGILGLSFIHYDYKCTIDNVVKQAQEDRERAREILSKLEEVRKQQQIQSEKDKQQDNKISQNRKEISEISDNHNNRYWSRSYSRKGDRSLRFEHDSTVPGFKMKWLTWDGGKYIERNVLTQLVEISLKRMPHLNIRKHPEITKLIVETAIAESSGGYFTSNKNGDYGVFQIRKEVGEELLLWLKANHTDVYKQVMLFFNEERNFVENLQSNVPFGIALCICEYWRKAGPNFTKHINTVEDRAIMWKSVYNTRKGKGTVKAYIDRNSSYDKSITKIASK